jgi:hypothetical protein
LVVASKANKPIQALEHTHGLRQMACILFVLFVLVVVAVVVLPIHQQPMVVILIL